MLASLLLAGCGPAPLTVFPVKGTVTLDGAPLADGEVHFKDDAAAKFGTFTVKGGAFTGECQAGNYRVEIHSYKDEAAKADATGYVAPEGTIKVETIPPAFNADSKLTAEVKSSGANEYKFEVTSK
jgi:hypothetical protein